MYQKTMFLVGTAVLLVGSLFAERYDQNSYQYDSNGCPSPCSSSCGNFRVRADYLYWRPCVDGASVALKQRQHTNIGFFLRDTFPILQIGNSLNDNAPVVIEVLNKRKNALFLPPQGSDSSLG